MKKKINSISDATDIILDKLEMWLRQAIALLPNVLLAIIIIIGFLLLARLMRSWITRLLDRVTNHQAISRLIASLVSASIAILGIFIALDVLELDKLVTSLLAGAGLAGLALSFAFQDTSANLISGVILAVRRPLRVGDLVKVGDNMGHVERINLRATVLHSLQGQLVIVPNKDVLQNAIINYSITGHRRIDLEVGVSYGDDLEKVKEITIKAIEKLDYLMQGRPVQLYYKEFGDSSINFTVQYWIDFSTKQIDYLQALSDGIMNIKKAYDENDIMIPFPIRTLDFGIKGGEKLSDIVLHTANGQERKS